MDEYTSDECQRTYLIKPAYVDTVQTESFCRIIPSGWFIFDNDNKAVFALSALSEKLDDEKSRRSHTSSYKGGDM